MDRIQPTEIPLTNRFKSVQIPLSNIMRTLEPGKNEYFTVTETASALGISKQTLLRYEARGIFPKAHRNRLNRWREYTAGEIQELRKLMGR